MRTYLPKSMTLFVCAMTILFHCTKESQPVSDYDFDELQIEVVSGNNQTGQSETVLPDPVVIEVTDNDGYGVEGLELLFEIVEGEGIIRDGSIFTTDEEGRIEISWRIGPGYNAIRFNFAEESARTEAYFLYAIGDQPQGINRTRTLNSLQRVTDAFYTVQFFGDYESILQNCNGRFLLYTAEQNSPAMDDFYCSLFTAFGNSDAYLFGRSFDNPPDWDCLTLLGLYDPPDGYRSLALSRMRDYGYEPGVNFDAMDYDDLSRILESAFFPPDGINEHGLVIGLANVRGLSYGPDPSKESIFITRMVREVLDHARTVEEAAVVVQQYNIFCPRVGSLDVHALVGDATGRSAILEFYDGEMRVIPNTESWQVITNSPAYNISIESQRSACWRYNTNYQSLSHSGGNVDWRYCMDLLSTVGNQYTQWTAVYDMTNVEAIVAINFDFSEYFHFRFDDDRWESDDSGTIE